MKKIVILFAAILIIAGFSTRVVAQSTSDTKSTDVNAQVLSAISLTVAHPLEFGGFTPGAGGNVIVPSTGVRSYTGGVTLVNGTVTFGAASYTVSGTKLASYSIVFPASTTVKNTSGTGNETMDVTSLECSYASKLSSFNSSGADAFTIGGTLTAINAQAPGVYHGTFDVTVAY